MVACLSWFWTNTKTQICKRDIAYFSGIPVNIHSNFNEAIISDFQRNIQTSIS
jgi:hypothetical protein